jgi:hypothetical protein
VLHCWTANWGLKLSRNSLTQKNDLLHIHYILHAFYYQPVSQDVKWSKIKTLEVDIVHGILANLVLSRETRKFSCISYISRRRQTTNKHQLGQLGLGGGLHTSQNYKNLHKNIIFTWDFSPCTTTYLNTEWDNGGPIKRRFVAASKITNQTSVSGCASSTLS